MTRPGLWPGDLECIFPSCGEGVCFVSIPRRHRRLRVISRGIACPIAVTLAAYGVYPGRHGDFDYPAAGEVPEAAGVDFT